MKVPFGPMPWDMIVFLTITTGTFGMSIYKMAYQTSPSLWSSQIQESEDRSLASADHSDPEILDVGCIERRLKQQATSYRGALRVRGKFCHVSQKALKQFQGITVKNVTLGLAGEILLNPDGQNFVSEPLPLREGKNIIEVQWVEKPGADPRTYIAEIEEHLGQQTQTKNRM